MALPPAADRSGALAPALDSMTLLAAAVIVHDVGKRRVVLLQRGPGAKYCQGKWDLPIGKSDPGEPVTDTAARELREETGLVVDPAALRVAHVIHGAWGVESPNGFLTVVFTTQDWSGEPVNSEPEKHSAVRWFDIDALPGEMVPSTGHALRCVLDDGPRISLHGWQDRTPG
ncbi:NUDIX domain-containing protein [Streptomyces sp. DSM 41987]|uniref:NUDIX domain-containing protein n=1 Tax=Streptomyces TaxID=1883 RepID=UPI003608BCAC